jgi:hypothetical protein
MTMRGCGLTLKRCFNAVVGNGTYTIVLVLREEVEINQLLVASRVRSIAKNELQQILQPKRRMITE